MMTGMFYGVGVGPGDSGLLTVKGAKIIGSADIIIAPRSEKTDDSTALNIAKEYINEKTEIVDMIFPMIYDQDALDEAWLENRKIIGEYLEQGKKVVFLTLGDPMFYSTYIYVFRLLKDANFPIETIPGIPAFCAIASHIGFPLVEGDNIISIIPATADAEKIAATMKVSNNLVIMKSSRYFDNVVKNLDENGFLSNAVMVSKCGLPEEKIVRDLKNSSASDVNYLSTILARRN